MRTPTGIGNGAVPPDGPPPVSLERQEELFLALGFFWFEAPPLYLQKNPRAVRGLSAIVALMDEVERDPFAAAALSLLACIYDQDRYKFDTEAMLLLSNPTWANVCAVLDLLRAMPVDPERDFADRGQRLREIILKRKPRKCRVSRSKKVS